MQYFSASKKCKTQNCIAKLSSLKCLNHFLKLMNHQYGLFSDMFESLKGVNLATKIWEVSSENSTPIYIFLILAENNWVTRSALFFFKKDTKCHIVLKNNKSWKKILHKLSVGNGFGLTIFWQIPSFITYLLFYSYGTIFGVI